MKNRALSERIALLKELQSVGDVNLDERQIKDLSLLKSLSGLGIGLAMEIATDDV